jgi:hypothetical protein
VKTAGETFSMQERVVVAPTWGRLRAEPLVEGRKLRAGTVIGRLVEAGVEIALVCPVHAVFLSWMVIDGERIRPGTPVARLRSVGRGRSIHA